MHKVQVAGIVLPAVFMLYKSISLMLLAKKSRFINFSLNLVMKRKILLFLSVCFVFSVSSQVKTLTKEQYRDKTLAMLLGHCGGISTGYEFEHNGNYKLPKLAMPDEWFKILRGSLGLEPFGRSPYTIFNYPTNPINATGNFRSDDDIHIDLFNQFIFETYGPQVSYHDYKKAWVGYNVKDLGSGAGAKEMMLEGFFPPFTGMRETGNRLSFLPEAYIGTETIGANFPGMPNTAVRYNKMAASVVGEWEPVLWAQFWASAYSIAYFETDARVAVQKAIDALPTSSPIRDAYNDCITLHNLNKNTSDGWRTSVISYYDNYARYTYDKGDLMEVGNPNNAFGILSILHGNNDYMTTLKIVSLAGLDGDCTAASVCGLMGIIKGMSGTPSEFKTYIYNNGNGQYENNWNNGGMHIEGDYPHKQKFDDLVSLYQRNTERMLLSYGGAVTDSEYHIQSETPSNNFVILDNYGFEKGNITGWTLSAGAWGMAEKQSNGDSGYTANTGKWKGTVGGGGKLYKVVSGLKPNTMYKIKAFIMGTNGNEVRLYADNYGGPYVYANKVQQLEGRNEYAARTIFVQTGSNNTSMEIGLHCVSGSWACIDDITMEELPNTQVTRYEAENARFGDGARASGNFVGWLNGNVAWLEFDINAPQKGIYSVRVNYSNATEISTAMAAYMKEFGLQSRLKCIVNGENLGQVLFPKTGNTWDTFSKNEVELLLSLEAGNNTVRFQNHNGSSVNVDYIDVALESEKQPAPAFKENVYYKIINKASGKGLNVDGISVENGALINQWDYLNGTNQQWQVIKCNNGTYKILSRHSGKVLDNANTNESGIQIIQWDDLTSWNTKQQWDIIPIDGRYFKIINKASGKALDNSGGRTNNGNMICQWEYIAGNAAQAWEFIVVSSADGIRNTTGLQSEQSKNEIMIYPTLFSSDVTISFTSEEAKGIDICLYSVTGLKVLEKSYGIIPAGSHQLTLSAAELAAGNYIYRLRTGEKIMTGKLQKR